jgi:endonuclease YncB( thermonuclease family)
MRMAGPVLACVLAAALFGHPLVSALGSIPLLSGPTHSLAADDVAVLDGETLRLAGHVVRLDGVQPPHRDGCPRGADCAGRAALHLAAMVQDQRVACQLTGADPAVAHCMAGGRDLNFALVADGWAEARDNAPVLKRAEDSARARHLGLWAAR